MRLAVKDTFQIAGRGLIALLDGTTALAIGRKHAVTLIRPNGTKILVNAYKEMLKKHQTRSTTDEAFLLVELTKNDVPIGSIIVFDSIGLP